MSLLCSGKDGLHMTQTSRWYVCHCGGSRRSRGELFVPSHYIEAGSPIVSSPLILPSLLPPPSRTATYLHRRHQHRLQSLTTRFTSRPNPIPVSVGTSYWTGLPMMPSCRADYCMAAQAGMWLDDSPTFKRIHHHQLKTNTQSPCPLGRVTGRGPR